MKTASLKPRAWHWAAWRTSRGAWEAEKILVGAAPNEATFRAAADAELKDARGFEYNGFKIELAKRVIVGALREVAEKAGGTR